MAPTQPVSFRFTAADLAELDLLAEVLTRRLGNLTGKPVGYPFTRSMALRYAVRWTLEAHAMPEGGLPQHSSRSELVSPASGA